MLASAGVLSLLAGLASATVLSFVGTLGSVDAMLSLVARLSLTVLLDLMSRLAEDFGLAAVEAEGATEAGSASSTSIACGAFEPRETAGTFSSSESESFFRYDARVLKLILGPGKV